MLFTYQDFHDGSVPNTNNALESLNSVIKTKLRNHRGLSLNRRELLLANYCDCTAPINRGRFNDFRCIKEP